MLRSSIKAAAAFAAIASLLLSSCSKTSSLPEGLYAVITTPKGDITLSLAYDKTPLTVGSFVGLAEGKLGAAKGKPFFDGLTFHRVEPAFVIQGGDPAGNGTGGPGYEFPNEIVPELRFDSAGVLGMANSGPDTNGSQFFITLKEAAFLDGNYTVFGRVVAGQDVVSRIAVGDKMTRVRIIRQGAAAKAFETDQASFDRRKAAIAAESAKKAEATRQASIDEINKRWPDLARGPDGIFSKILKAGSGAPPVKGASVSVNYKGMLIDGRVFDQSSTHGGPFKLEVGLGKVIPGWDSTLLSMKPGEKRFVVIPPELAYGSRGAGGVIPPDSFLAFEIELVSVGK